MLYWTGQTNHTFFIQASPNLSEWTWAPNIEPGFAGPMSYEVDGPINKAFFRLIRTDQTAADLDHADFDGDGISNIDEITPHPRPGGNNGNDALSPNIQTNPLDPDTDHDGLKDKWEEDHGLDPTDDGSRNINNGPNGDPDKDGFTNLQEQTAGTDPGNPDSHPPGTPLPGGAPLLVGEQVTVSNHLWGFPGFQTPAKHYLHYVSHLSSTDGDDDGGGEYTYTEFYSDLKNGTLETTFTGMGGEDYGDTWTINSDTSRSRDGIEYDYGGDIDISTASETLSEEYTIPAFVANVESWIPAYSGHFTVGTDTASIYLTPEASDPEPATDYSITKLKYKWQVNAGPGQIVNWLEVFTPADGTTPVVEPKSWSPSPTDTESPVYEIDPTAKNGKKNGVYSLLSVEVVVRKKSETDTPPTGLCVKAGEIITYDFNGSAPTSAYPFAPSTVKWQIRQLKRDGSFNAWTPVPGEGCELDYDTPTGGIFQAKAIFTPPGGATQEYQYIRKKDEPNATESQGHYNEIYRKGQPDYFGIADTDKQINSRWEAHQNLGSTAYATDATLLLYEGGPTLGAGTNKCNAFVFHKASDGGAIVPLINTGSLSSTPKYPPVAYDWWESVKYIPHWERIPDDEFPQPGYVVAGPDEHADPANDKRYGHCGILDYDGAWIQAGRLTVSKFPHLTTAQDKPYQPAGFRKY